MYIAKSALNTALLLVVLDHLNFVETAVICTVSDGCSFFAFASNISPSYSSFGTIALNQDTGISIDSLLKARLALHFVFWYVRIPRAIL